jgi:NADH-quinone oxidoreductase subunit L
MGGVWKKLPYTYSLMIIGTLALTGFPFLSGFYSKEAIIEFAFLKGNTLGMYAAYTGIFTALLTSIYSWRLIFKTFHGNYNNSKVSVESMHESPLVMLLPLLVLAIGAIFAGILFKGLFIGHEISYDFWGSSIKFLEPLSIKHPPTWFLFLTPTLVIISIPISFYLFIINKRVVEELVRMNRPLYLFLKNKWYFDELYDYIFVNPSKRIGHFLWKKIDGSIIDRFGPDGISQLIKNLSIRAVKFQSGFIYQYAFVILIGFSILLTLLILN